jgi:Domain of unknown function (DUF4291)
MSTRIPVESYERQSKRWPCSGRHILAHFDDDTVVVYQAFRPSIAAYATEHQRFGGPEFSFSRMSWVKPNFLWMMHRSGWGTKEGQEATLAVWLRRRGFETLLTEAVHSNFVPEVYGREEDWRAALAHSSVRLQWDPDHDPHGAPLARRAVQLGLRGDTLRRYAEEWILAVEDISSFVTEQRQRLRDGNSIDTPSERVMPIADTRLAMRIGIE